MSVSVLCADTVEKKKNWFQALELEYEVNAGVNIGGASPIPLPAEIRRIDSYNPDLNLRLGASVTKWIDMRKKWGVNVGVRVETKGMETKASVKNYGMEILDNGNKLKGRWTGMVHTKYHSRQFVVPITGVYKINRRLKVNFGLILVLLSTTISTDMCMTDILGRETLQATNMFLKMTRRPHMISVEI